MKALSPSIISNQSFWDKVFQSRDLFSVYQPSVQVAHELIKVIPRNAHVLMPGCGMGALARQVGFKRLDIAWTLTDFSPVALSHSAREWPAPLKGDRDNFSLQDVEQPWKFVDDCFDVVILDGVIEYVADPAFVMREAYRVAAGMMIATFPLIPNRNKSSPISRWHFDPVDPKRLMTFQTAVHHLIEENVMLAVSSLLI